MTEFFDLLETRDPAEREAALCAALPAQIAAAQATAALAEILHGVDARAIGSRQALAQLPVHAQARAARTAEGAARPATPSAASRPSAGAARARVRHARRVFQSPGPIYEPEGHAGDYWRFGRALFAAGFRAGDLVHNSFSYHLTPAGSMMETGALAIGCTVFPGGVGNTELQLQAMLELRADAYAGTPSFLRIALEKADEMGLALPALRKASVGGEAFPAALRDALLARGIEAYQSYGTADVGLIAYETAARQGLVLDEGVIVEIVRPGSGEPVPEGEVGEVVVTTLNPDYPLVRFGTGDLSAILPGRCPTGRTHTRIKGWMGRADQTAKVRGMFVHASQVAELMKRHPELARARLVVEGEMANDRMTLHAETASRAEGLPAALAGSMRDITKLRCEVRLVDPGSLPNDGKVIEDLRAIG